jgi:Na+-transporting methylmalonyl-CoA/oxaloacetate decarboxylase gamma subunit
MIAAPVCRSQGQLELAPKYLSKLFRNPPQGEVQITASVGAHDRKAKERERDHHNQQRFEAVIAAAVRDHNDLRFG